MLYKTKSGVLNSNEAGHYDVHRLQHMYSTIRSSSITSKATLQVFTMDNTNLLSRCPRKHKVEDTAEPDFSGMTEADFLCHLVRHVNDQSNPLQPGRRMKLSMALHAPDRDVQSVFT
jgi:hypothetical protein